MKSNKYQTIQKLITYWEEFEETNSSVTFKILVSGLFKIMTKRLPITIFLIIEI